MAKSALVWSEILTLFVNTLTTDDKYSRQNMLNITQYLEAPLSQKQKIFCGFFIAFLKCPFNLENLKKIDEYLRLVISRIKRSCFRTPVGSQRVNGFQRVLKWGRHHYQRIFSWIRGKLSWAKSALVWSEILTLFVNALTTVDKYSRRNMQNITQKLEARLCQKQEGFSEVFISFLKCALNL